MSSNLIKIQSNESGSFNVNNKLISWTIPESSKFVNLTESYLVFNLQASASDTPTVALDTKYGYGFNNARDISCLIRHARLSSAKKGTIEEVHNVNVLLSNINEVLFSDGRDKGNIYGDNSLGYNPMWIEKKKDGSIVSQQRSSLMLDLKKVFGLFKEGAQFPMESTGDLTIHVELEDDTTNIIPKLFTQYYEVPTEGTISSATLPADNKIKSAVAQQKFRVGDKVVVIAKIATVNRRLPRTITDVTDDGTDYEYTFDANIGTNGDAVAVNNETIANKRTADWTATRQVIHYMNDLQFGINRTLATADLKEFNVTLADEQDIPFHVGQKVKVSRSLDGNTPGDYLSTHIVSISQTGSTVTYTLNDDLGADGEAMSESYIFADNIEKPVDQGAGSTPVSDATISYNIVDCQTVVPQWMLTSKQEQEVESSLKMLKAIEFLSWKLERYNWGVNAINSRTSKQFDLEQNVVNALMMQVNNNAEQALLARWDNIESYRIQVNNLDMSNRDIVPNKSLHRDQLQYAMASSRIPINNLKYEAGSDVGHNNNTVDQFLIIPQAVEPKPEKQTLRLNINQSGVASQDNQLFIYKHQLKMLEL